MTHPGSAAQSAVKRAVQRGDLEPVRSLRCVDCGAPATAYDHRDYNKPLDVEHTCTSCNAARGSAIPKGCSTYTHRTGTGFVVAPNGVVRVGIEAIDFGSYEDA